MTIVQGIDVRRLCERLDDPEQCADAVDDAIRVIRELVSLCESNADALALYDDAVGQLERARAQVREMSHQIVGAYYQVFPLTDCYAGPAEALARLVSAAQAGNTARA